MYEYDEQGRLIRSRPEPEWDEEQQGWMLALAALRADRCPACGGPAEECLGADAENAFVAPPPLRCHRTTAVSIKQADYKDAPHGHALLWRAERR